VVLVLVAGPVVDVMNEKSLVVGWDVDNNANAGTLPSILEQPSRHGTR
jgi:hypothetical protein